MLGEPRFSHQQEQESSYSDKTDYSPGNDHRYPEDESFSDSGAATKDERPRQNGHDTNSFNSLRLDVLARPARGKHGPLHWGRFHSRDLQWFLKRYQFHIANKTPLLLQVPLSVRQSLRWWSVSANMNKGKHISVLSEETLVTDASLSDWGALWNDEPVQGRWSESESRMPINLLELRAICLALQHWGPRLRGKHLLIRTDNVSAKAQVNKQGGSRSTALHKEAVALFNWVESCLASIRAEHIRGRDNLGVDLLSRLQVLAGEWSPKRSSFEEIIKEFGTREVDLFASFHNRQLQRFFSRYFHPQAEGIDALTSAWPEGLLYAFPPIPLLPSVIRKIKHQRAQVILVAPWWPRRPWFSALQSMSVQDPIRLPVQEHLLHQGPILHPHPQKLQLTGWILRGYSC